MSQKPVCPLCGPVWADEDGCCGMCGCSCCDPEVAVSVDAVKAARQAAIVEVREWADQQKKFIPPSEAVTSMRMIRYLLAKLDEMERG